MSAVEEDVGGLQPDPPTQVEALTAAKFRTFLFEVAEGVCNYRSLHSRIEQVKSMRFGQAWALERALGSSRSQAVGGIRQHRRACPMAVGVTVRGTDKLAAVVADLARRSCWFTVTPHPWDLYRVTVKQDAARWLPTTLTKEDWENTDVVSDARLLEAAAGVLGSDFTEFEDGEALAPSDMRVVQRCEDGFVVTAHAWVNYPKDEVL